MKVRMKRQRDSRRPFLTIAIVWRIVGEECFARSISVDAFQIDLLLSEKGTYRRFWRNVKTVLSEGLTHRRFQVNVADAVEHEPLGSELFGLLAGFR